MSPTHANSLSTLFSIPKLSLFNHLIYSLIVESEIKIMLWICSAQEVIFYYFSPNKYCWYASGRCMLKFHQSCTAFLGVAGHYITKWKMWNGLQTFIRGFAHSFFPFSNRTSKYIPFSPTNVTFIRGTFRTFKLAVSSTRFLPLRNLHPPYIYIIIWPVIHFNYFFIFPYVFFHPKHHRNQNVPSFSNERISKAFHISVVILNGILLPYSETPGFKLSNDI